MFKRVIISILILSTAGTLAACSSNSSNQKLNNNSTDTSKKTLYIDSLKPRINDALLKNLNEDQGFATGKLDENRKPLQNGQVGKINPDFIRSTFVSKMVYVNAGLDGVQVYLTDDAINKLNKQEVLAVATKAQSLAALVLTSEVANNNKEQDLITKSFNLDASHKMKQFIVLSDPNGGQLAQTSAWNNQFKDKDFE